MMSARLEPCPDKVQGPRYRPTDVHTDPDTQIDTLTAPPRPRTDTSIGTQSLPDRQTHPDASTRLPPPIERDAEHAVRPIDLPTDTQHQTHPERLVRWIAPHRPGPIDQTPINPRTQHDSHTKSPSRMNPMTDPPIDRPDATPGHSDAGQVDQEAVLKVTRYLAFRVALFALFILPRIPSFCPARWRAGRRRVPLRRRPRSAEEPAVDPDTDTAQRDKARLRKARRWGRRRRSQRQRHKPPPRPFDATLGFPGEGPAKTDQTAPRQMSPIPPPSRRTRATTVRHQLPDGAFTFITQELSNAIAASPPRCQSPVPPDATPSTPPTPVKPDPAADGPDRRRSAFDKTAARSVSVRELNSPAKVTTPSHSGTGAAPASRPSRPCPLYHFDCKFSTGAQQLKKFIDHVNTHQKDFGDGGALWAELTYEACREAKLDVHRCTCGLFYPNNPTGREAHRRLCAAASAEDAMPSASGVNATAYSGSGAFAGITTQVFPAVVAAGTVKFGSLQFTITDHGSAVPPHSSACFYLSCCAGSETKAIRLKQQLAGPATGLARARKPDCKKNFAGLNMMAEEEVFLAHALCVGPLVVVDTTSNAGQGTLYRSPGKTDGEVTFVLEGGGHYRRLAGPATTVAQLCAEANNAGPVLPGPSAQPRPTRAPQAPNRRGRPRLRPLPATQRRQSVPPPAPPPRLPGLHIEFDGGSRGNPGRGGSGSLLWLVQTDSTTTLLAKRTAFLGESGITNNLAEFNGLLNGLELARDFLAQTADPTPGLLVTTSGDSQLAISVMMDQAECRDPALLALADQASAIISELEGRGCECAFRHVRRAFNVDADQLSNDAMNTKSSTNSVTADFSKTRTTLPLLRKGSADAPEQARDKDRKSQAATRRSGHIPRLTSLPSREELLAWLAAIHKDSRALGKLDAVRQWTAQATADWIAACAPLTRELAMALDGGDELALVQAILDLIELPSLTLRQHCRGYRPQDQPKVTPGRTQQGDLRLRRATTLAFRDRADKAMQEVLSNGCAEHSQETLKILSDMHPSGTGTRKRDPGVPQLKVSAKQAQRLLFVLAGKRRAAEDCFGWSAALLYPLRGQKKLGRNIPFIHQVARLVARIASAEVPDIVGQILTCGDLIALHKRSAAEQAEDTHAGIPPSIRPVNKGCNFLKWALKLAVRSPAARAAARNLEPLQSGLAKRGPEAFCHTLRSLREQGFAILKTDFRNGFNAISRQAVLDAVQQQCPQLTALMNLFYTVDGACFFTVENEVRIIWSAEGVRMGCPLGSFGFDLALQAVLLRVKQLDISKDIVFRALTDDVNLAVRLSDNQTDARATLRRLRRVLDELASDAKATLNLDLNLAKCALLLPPGHRTVPDGFAGLKVETRGMQVAGAPIGDDDYCTEAVGRKVDAALDKARALRGIHPQVGLLLLRMCCLPQLNYLSQVVPPHLAEEHFARFDAGIAALVEDLLTLPSSLPKLACPEARAAVFKRRLRLPLRFNGAGLVGVHGICAAAFAGSVAAAAAVDALLASNIGGLARFARPSRLILQARLAPLGTSKINILLHMPLADDADLFDLSRYVEQDSDDKKSAPKLQQMWSKAVHVAAAQALRPDEEALGESDLVHAEARAHPASNILQAPLSNPFFRFAPAEFVAWFCFQFRIPQPARLGNANADGIEQCLARCANPNVDLHANHASTGQCKAALDGRGKRHRFMKEVVSHHAAKAGCQVSWVTEDKTTELLMHEFTPLQCSTMFHVKPSADAAKQARNLRSDLVSAGALPAVQRKRELGELDARLAELMADVNSGMTAGRGLRLDGTIQHLASGQLVHYDVSATHTTTKSHIKREVRLSRSRRAAGKDGIGIPSAGLLKAHQDKLDRYALFEAIAQRQVVSGLRTAPPIILPVVLTTHGEFCPGALQLQEWLTNKYRARLRLEGDRDDGEKEEDLTATFRREFRTSLLVAVAKGTALTLIAAGQPFRRRAQAHLPTTARPSPFHSSHPPQFCAPTSDKDGEDYDSRALHGHDRSRGSRRSRARSSSSSDSVSRKSNSSETLERCDYSPSDGDEVWCASQVGSAGRGTRAPAARADAATAAPAFGRPPPPSPAQDPPRGATGHGVGSDHSTSDGDTDSVSDSDSAAGSGSSSRSDSGSEASSPLSAQLQPGRRSARIAQRLRGLQRPASPSLSTTHSTLDIAGFPLMAARI